MKSLGVGVRRAAATGALAAALIACLPCADAEPTHSGSCRLLSSAAAGPEHESAPTSPKPRARVMGQVLYRNRPLRLVRVDVIGSHAHAITDERGRFEIDDTPLGDRVLSVSRCECDRRLINIRVRSGDLHRITVRLDCSPPPREAEPRFDAASFQARPQERSRVGTPCPVHPRCPLELDTVRVSYGYPRGESLAEVDSCPNVNDHVNGGCVRGDVQWTEVAYCRECRRTYRRWLSNDPCHWW